MLFICYLLLTFYLVKANIALRFVKASLSSSKILICFDVSCSDQIHPFKTPWHEAPILWSKHTFEWLFLGFQCWLIFSWLKHWLVFRFSEFVDTNSLSIILAFPETVDLELRVIAKNETISVTESFVFVETNGTTCLVKQTGLWRKVSFQYCQF